MDNLSTDSKSYMTAKQRSQQLPTPYLRLLDSQKAKKARELLDRAFSEAYSLLETHPAWFERPTHYDQFKEVFLALLNTVRETPPDILDEFSDRSIDFLCLVLNRTFPPSPPFLEQPGVQDIGVKKWSFPNYRELQVDGRLWEVIESVYNLYFLLVSSIRNFTNGRLMRIVVRLLDTDVKRELSYLRSIIDNICRQPKSAEQLQEICIEYFTALSFDSTLLQKPERLFEIIETKLKQSFGKHTRRLMMSLLKMLHTSGLESVKTEFVSVTSMVIAKENYCMDLLLKSMLAKWPLESKKELLFMEIFRDVIERLNGLRLMSDREILQLGRLLLDRVTSDHNQIATIAVEIMASESYNILISEQITLYYKMIVPDMHRFSQTHPNPELKRRLKFLCKVQKDADPLIFNDMLRTDTEVNVSEAIWAKYREQSSSKAK
jgi:hypothetical protein